MQNKEALERHLHRPLNRILIATAFGLIGFGVNFLDLQLFESPTFKVSILLGLFFPLLIALTWGWRYGLLAALAGGCQTMWWLWRDDGWGVLYSVPIFTLWIVWHGWWTDYRRSHSGAAWWTSAFVIELPFRLVSELGFYTLFRWLVSHNPPPWHPTLTGSQVPLSWVHTVAIKHTITGYILLLLVTVVLSLGPVRRFFGLRWRPGQHDTHAIYAAAVLIIVTLWALTATVEYLVFNPKGQTWWELAVLDVEPRTISMRGLYVLVSLIAALTAARLVNRRAYLHERLKHLNRVLLAVRNVNQLIVHTTDRDPLLQRICVCLTDTRGYYNAWIALLDDAGRLITSKEAGLHSTMPSLVAPLQDGDLPHCGRRALEQPGIAVTRDPPTACPDCPVASDHEGRGAMTTRLAYKDHVYGLLSVSIPIDLVDDEEEHALFLEVAGDIAFALHNMELRVGREQAEAALHRERDLLNLIAETSPVAITVLNRDGEITFANQQAEDVLGLTEDQITQRAYNTPTWHITDENGKPFPDEDLPFRRVMESSQPVYDVHHAITHEDGHRTLLSVNAAPLLDDAGQIQGVVASLEDITARTRAAEALRESERQKQLILDSTTEMIAYYDLELRVIWANRAAGVSVGTTPEKLVGRHCYEIWAGRETPCPNCPVLKARDTKAPQQIEQQTPEGRIWAIRGYPVFDSENEVMALVEFGTDISDRRMMEEQLRHQEKLAAVGQLAGGIAHDFNNILASILLYAELAQKHKPLAPKVAQALETITIEGNRAAELVSQILDFSRRAMIRPQPLDLVPFVQEVIGIFRRTIPERVHMTLDLGVGACIIEADPTRIQQALLNLVANARDAMPDGGELQIGLHRVEIEPDETAPVADMPSGTWARLTVADTGEGMTEAVQSHLFEPFFTTKEPGEGTGLGLAQVHGIVKQHHGYIDVTSAPGEGSTFRLYFPCQSRPQPKPADEIMNELPQGAGECILVVEDARSLREIMAEFLTTLGYTVLTATNGREALASLQENHADLLITDWVMPELGGDALLHAARKDHPMLPALAITGYLMDADTEALRASGFVSVLTKPFEMQELATEVRRALSTRET